MRIHALTSGIGVAFIHTIEVTTKESEVKSKTDQELENATFVVTATLGGLIVATLLQIYSWDKYALDIIPIAAKEVFSMTSPSDWEQKAQICMELKKWDCVETEYAKAAQTDGKLYVRLGNFQFERKKFDRAARSYSIYFQHGVENPEVALAYAKTLTELNQFEDAAKYFEIVLDRKTDTLQVPVIHSYVKILFKNGRFGRAKTLIEDVRKSSPTAAQFMEAEYQQMRKVRTASR